jgi:hypothetical protein
VHPVPLVVQSVNCFGVRSRSILSMNQVKSVIVLRITSFLDFVHRPVF